MYKKSGKVLKLWHVNANSVDVMRLNILSWGLLDPIGTSRVNYYRYCCGHKNIFFRATENMRYEFKYVHRVMGFTQLIITVTT